MFIGEYTVSLDNKGRMAVPAKFRLGLDQEAVVTKGLDQSLVLYPKKEWESLAAKLSGLSITKSDSRAVARHFLSGAFEVEIDKQGRMMVPEYLRKFAKLTKRVVVTGLYNRIEVWDEESWNSYKAATERESNAIAEGLGEIGV